MFILAPLASLFGLSWFLGVAGGIDNAIFSVFAKNVPVKLKKYNHWPIYQLINNILYCTTVSSPLSGAARTS